MMRTFLEVLESERDLLRQLDNKEQHLQTVESMLLESDERAKEWEKRAREVQALYKMAVDDLGRALISNGIKESTKEELHDK